MRFTACDRSNRRGTWAHEPGNPDQQRLAARTRRSGFARSLADVLVLLFCMCCAAPQQGFVEPRGSVVVPADADDTDGIPYRTLTRADFQATRLPDGTSAYAKRIGALTCAHINTSRATRFTIRELEPEVFEGRFEELSFLALMDRKCSWWNPKRSQLPEAYILQHEQIHFALTELEARQLNREAPEVIAEFVARGQSVEEVRQLVQTRLNGLVQTALERLLQRNREFDADTSAKYAPEDQQRWFERVSEELSLEPSAR